MTDQQRTAPSTASFGQEPPVSTVFFSYSRQDQAQAIPIIHMLEQAGFAVWWDGLIEGGDRFSRTTDDALQRSQAVVVLWSRTSIESHWVHDEATFGRDRRILVPVTLDGVDPPLGFRQFQVLNLADRNAMPRLLHAVSALHGRPTQPLPALRMRSPKTMGRRALFASGAVVLLVAGGAGLWRSGLIGGAIGVANRIAVLPLENLSGDPGQGYLSDGLTAEIRSMLAQNQALQVVGQASSEAFEGAKIDLVSIAKKLRAAFLLDGTVQLSGEIVRITIELIDGSTGVNRMNRAFEMPMDNIFAVQREVASAITAELSSQMSTVGKAKGTIGGTSNAVAYDHYLRGKDLYAHAKDEGEERSAVTQFDAAIAADPKFAAAYAGRSRSLTAVSSQYGSAVEIRRFHNAAVASARRAIALAPDLADAQSTLAFTLFQGGLAIKAARKPFDLSRLRGEGESAVMARFAFYCAATGRDQDAVAAITRALTLDPLNALVHRLAGTVHYAARRYREAIDHWQQALSINPKLGDTHARIGMALLAEGKNAAGLAECEQDSHKWSKLAGVAIAQRRLGNGAAADAAMAALTSDTDTVSLYQQAQVLAQWGEGVMAVTALQNAYEQRDAGLTAARYDPMLDPVRQQPGFIRLLKTMGYD